MNASASKVEGSPNDVLASLCKGFGLPAGPIDGVESVSAEQLPSDARTLLDHNDHMTSRLQAHFGGPVVLKVLQDHRDGDTYRRQIVLTLDEGGKVVELGLIRLNFAHVPDAVRDEILELQMPLGDILIRHDVMRVIEPQWFLRFSEMSPLLAAFGFSTKGDVFGRIGTIHCNGSPAIELLEIVVNTKR